MATLFNVSVKRMLVVALVLLMGCKDSDKNSSLIFEALNESLERSNEVIEERTNNALIDLNNRKKKPESKEKAIYWGGKADSIKLKTAEIILFVDSLLLKLKKDGIKLKEQKVFNLYDRLKSYRGYTLNVEETINKVFEKKLPIFNNKFSLSFKDKNAFKEVYFKTNPELAINTLIKVKNDLRVSENMLITFCNYQSMPGCVLDFSRFTAIAAANSTRLGTGDELVITAGIGEFTLRSKPEFIINGEKIKPNEIGIGEYKMKVSNKPGKYKVHVQIKFIMPDGLPNDFEEDIEYTVVE